MSSVATRRRASLCLVAVAMVVCSVTTKIWAQGSGSDSESSSRDFTRSSPQSSSGNRIAYFSLDQPSVERGTGFGHGQTGPVPMQADTMQDEGARAAGSTGSAGGAGGSAFSDSKFLWPGFLRGMRGFEKMVLPVSQPLYFEEPFYPQ